ncbi:MAG: TetR/AcrR family transcriptional regulator C-terminal domain-containing protein [Clostridia bacterium]|nr:TetR/AcrR family transcriptional regulator C-terminal domain-containing protein [Clostridia bacterium]
MAKAEYRSSIRSKNLIKKALAKLIHEKDFSKITVSDIIREADISRGTFYAHYSDINSVIEQIECEEVKNLMDFVDRFKIENVVDGTHIFIEKICEYLSRDMEYYRMLANSNIINNFICRLVNIYYDSLMAAMNINDSALEKNKANTYLLYVTSGVKASVTAWLNGDITGTPSEFAKTLGDLVEYTKIYYNEKLN